MPDGDPSRHPHESNYTGGTLRVPAPTSRSRASGQSAPVRTSLVPSRIPWWRPSSSRCSWSSTAPFAVDPDPRRGDVRRRRRSAARACRRRIWRSRRFRACSTRSPCSRVGQHIALLLWIDRRFRRVARAARATPPRRTTRARSRSPRRSAARRISRRRMPPARSLPRPMAAARASRTRPSSPIDFHAHTKYSHDGRPGWTEDDVRRWHRGAGFDVAYITDHRSFEGAERGIAANPGVGGRGNDAAPGARGVLQRRARQHSQRGPTLQRRPHAPTSRTSMSNRSRSPTSFRPRRPCSSRRFPGT